MVGHKITSEELAKMHEDIDDADIIVIDPDIIASDIEQGLVTVELASTARLYPEGQADISRSGQISMAGYDTLGVCIFAGFGFAAAPETISALLNARYGWDVDENILQELGRETLKLEREFNKGAGFTSADDRLPEWMTREPLAPTNAVFDVPAEDLDNVFNW